MNRATLLGLITIALALTLVPRPALASGGPGADDAAVQVRLGAFFPAGDSELWRAGAADFTQATSDFDDASVGASYVMSFGNYVELGFNADLYASKNASEYRDYVDGNGLPIIHDTTLAIAPLTVDVRALPFGRYRMRDERAVRRPVFYVGGGAGFAVWSYEEEGDFIDFSDAQLPVFYDRFRDDGTALELHALIGLELPVARSVNLLFEGRYSWAKDDLEQDFAFLDKIDLSGPSAHFGVAFRF